MTVNGNTIIELAALVAALSVMLAFYRGSIKRNRTEAERWQKTEDALSELTKDMKELVESKDKVHVAMYDQMKIDRDATNQRLRYLEEFWITLGRKSQKKLRFRLR